MKNYFSDHFWKHHHRLLEVMIFGVAAVVMFSFGLHLNNLSKTMINANLSSLEFLPTSTDITIQQARLVSYQPEDIFQTWELIIKNNNDQTLNNTLLQWNSEIEEGTEFITLKGNDTNSLFIQILPAKATTFTVQIPTIPDVSPSNNSYSISSNI
jgi:UTP:GlnB (protein PII) uridylyltransferase